MIFFSESPLNSFPKVVHTCVSNSIHSGQWNFVNAKKKKINDRIQYVFLMIFRFLSKCGRAFAWLFTFLVQARAPKHITKCRQRQIKKKKKRKTTDVRRKIHKIDAGTDKNPIRMLYTRAFRSAFISIHMQRGCCC